MGRRTLRRESDFVPICSKLMAGRANLFNFVAQEDDKGEFVVFRGPRGRFCRILSYLVGREMARWGTKPSSARSPEAQDSARLVEF